MKTAVRLFLLLALLLAALATVTLVGALQWLSTQDAVRLIVDLAGCCPQPLPAFKRAMAARGIDCGPVRPPLARPTAEQAARIDAVLAAHGITTADRVN